MTDATELAAELKAWRGKVPAWKAAEILGINLRTLQGIEQGRGFNYPSLLLMALEANKARIQRETEGAAITPASKG
jgi:hypothetical protein